MSNSTSAPKQRGYVLTGAPGAGKTAVLRLLEVNGHVVVEEAATDVIALRAALGDHEPWREDEVERVVADGVYETTVFFIRNRGVVAPTAARRISFADSLTFERLHERTYRDLGFQLCRSPSWPVARARRTHPADRRTTMTLIRHG